MQSLEKWQERLEGHFQTLASKRVESGFPIFALEHGFSEDEIDEISKALIPTLKARPPQHSHWLLWVVYATERGYSYGGDEYWRSFEEHTPKWELRDRAVIVPWFRKFQRQYHGVMPTGTWAEHFSIIAWPITHAILPRYLQRQFSRALYDLRFRLASAESLDPATIGRLLAANAHHASTRFQEFLQQEELTGRIVLALLGAQQFKGTEPIFPVTLGRIVSDLERVRNAREWLKETQRIVSDRFKGIGSGAEPAREASRSGKLGKSGTETTQLGIRPNLLLRHGGGSTWSVLMEVPSFQNVAVLNAEIQSFLQRTRCRMNGGHDMKPAGWLLAGNRKSILKGWPDSTKALIQFERPHPVLENLLQSECRLSPGPFWLFRIGSDGTAHEIVGRAVRPNHSYIVITKENLPLDHAWMSPCKVECNGVQSFRVAIPSHVPTEMTAWLRHLGLHVTRTIRVWPAGLPGRGWDGEGRSVWLTTESPCFGIAHDHPIDCYTIRIGDAETAIKAGNGQDPVFICIEPLPPGTHLLTIKARRTDTLESVATSPSAEGFMQLSVRDPQAWTSGIAGHPGLIVTIDPDAPNLDSFWKNEVRLSVLGPERYAVTFIVNLESADGRIILSEQVGSPMDLPVRSEEWHRRFSQFLQREDHAWSYLEARSGNLTIEGETLGKYTLRFEHRAKPLRWVMRHKQRKVTLRLVDDSGQNDTTPQVHFFSMVRPLKLVQLTPESALGGIAVDPPGGLFFAEHGKYSDNVLLSVGLTGQGLQGLGIRATCPEILERSISISDSLLILNKWECSRLGGFLSNARQAQVTNEIVAAIYEALYGYEWMQAESAYLSNPNSQQAITRLQRAVTSHGGFASVLRRDCIVLSRDSVKTTEWFKTLATRYGFLPERLDCTIAFTLATRPQHLARMYGSDLSIKIEAIRHKPEILRGARFVKLLQKNHAHQSSSQK